MDPYRVLGVAREDADDERIRQAYLAGLRSHSPERDPEGFQRLRDAFEQIADHRRRLAHALFSYEYPTAVSITNHALAPGQPRRPDAATLRAALAAGLQPD